MYYKEIEEASLMGAYHELEYSIKGYKGTVHAIINPESYHIFEPQEGDKNIDGYVFDAKLQAWVLPNSPHNVQFRGYMPTSERNGKAFIMPERG
jgi:hypothetical protein